MEDVDKKPVYDEARLESTLRLAFQDPIYYNVPRGIIRHDYDHTHAWRVSVVRDKAKFIEYFYDGESGSIENGLRRAILYRHEILEAFPVTITTDFKRGLSANPEERIRRIVEPGKMQPYIHWRATWHDSKYNRKNKSFSVIKFGEEEARSLALEAAKNNHNPVPKVYRIPDVYLEERWRAISRESVDSASSVNDYSKSVQYHSPEVVDSSPFGFEGGRRMKLHVSIERDRVLRNAKVAKFLAENGRINCEVCGFNFKEIYNFLSKNIIEVHHIFPLEKLNSATRVSLEDLILLCSNCHTAVHQGDAEENLRALFEIFHPKTM